jgi:hypothetical protein
MYKHYQTHEEVLKDLNGLFRTVDLEPYSSAMLNMFMQDVNTKIFGDGIITRRVSEGMCSRLRKALVIKLRKKYGEWINIYDLNAKDMTFTTNFNTIYRTDLGRLYGYEPGSIFDHLFYTTHSFEQFRERTKDIPMDLIKLAYKRVRKTEPTAADILRVMLHNADEFCETSDSIYVNIRTGIVVIEKYPKDIMIVKTYLNPDMDYPKLGWYTNNLCSYELVKSELRMKFAKLEKKERIDIPHIVSEQLDYETYVKYVSIPSTGVAL